MHILIKNSIEERQTDLLLFKTEELSCLKNADILHHSKKHLQIKMDTIFEFTSHPRDTLNYVFFNLLFFPAYLTSLLLYNEQLDFRVCRTC